MKDYPDLVVFLPGIGGSTLIRDGRPLWGGTWRAMVNAVARGGLADLELASPSEDDGVSAAGIVDDIHVLPGLWKIDAYGGFQALLCRSVGLVVGRNFRGFAYDWRRDSRISAARLAEAVERWLAEWRRVSGNEEARVVLVAHSMGGLVARHYMECLEGWRVVRRLITIGTPHRGSLDALGCLANGFARGIGPLRAEATDPLRSFPSVAQLLPTFACVEAADGMVRVQDAPALGSFGETIRSVAAEALEFHEEIWSAAERNQSLPGYSKDALSTVLSFRQPTFQSARPNDGGVELLSTFEGDDNGGDGTVPMVSAVPPGHDPMSATYVWGVHSRLAAEEGVQEHALGALRSVRIPMDRFRHDGSGPQVRLRLQDACSAGVPFELAATVSGGTEQTLSASAVRSDDGLTIRTTLQRSEGRFVAPLVLEEGAWRVSIAGMRAAAAEDVIVALRTDGTVAEARA